MAGQDDKEVNQEGSVAEDNVDPSETEPSTNTTNEVNFTEEYDFLDSKLDELNSALDFLEQKNDNIHERLKELLQSNRDIREQLQYENKMQTETNQ